MIRTSFVDRLSRVGRLGPAWQKAPLFETLSFVGALTAFLVAVPFGDFDTIIGDNIAQVAYFRVLFRENLSGSIGASSMKPGLVLLLGVAHDLSLTLFASTVLIQLVFALFAAGLVTIVARIAKDAGGLLAGVFAAVYLLACTPVPGMYTTGSSMVVFLPLLFFGIWLFTLGREGAGAIVLCLAALTRIEALAVLAWLCVFQQLWRRKWRSVVFTGTVTTLTVVLTAAVYYRLQGSVARFNAGGPPAGYLFLRDPSGLHRLLESLKYTVSASYETLAARAGPPSLLLPALLGVFSDRSRRIYASLLGLPLFLNVYIASGNGSAELRYFEFLLPAAACFGAAGLVAAMHFGSSGRSRRIWAAAGALLLVTISALALHAADVAYSAGLTFIAGGLGRLTAFRVERFSPRARNASAFILLGSTAILLVVRKAQAHKPGRAVYTLDAKRLLDSKKLPPHSRVLTEDDIIYSVIARAPDFFAHATALQYFNIQNDAERAKLLNATDYIALSRGRHAFYYLHYDPEKRGNSDPFRAALGRNESTNLYGHRLKLIDKSSAMSLFTVEPLE